MKANKKNGAQLLLIFLLAFLSLGALAGGLGLLSSPQGSDMSPPITVLENTPFDSFLIPGIILFLVLGISPLIGLYGLITKTTFFGIVSFKPYTEYHWSWTFAYGIGIALILWINIQLLLGVGFHILHFIYNLLGLLILIIVHLPGLKVAYRV